jgi:predicted RND superfamily exporter protein
MNRFLKYNLRNPWVGGCIALALCVLGVLNGLDIAVKLSLADLLPDKRQSVLDLHAVAKEVGGVGYTAVVVGPVAGNPEAKFPELARAVETLDTVRYAYYERETFLLQKQALYLIRRADFDKLLSSTDALVYGGKTGGFLDLGLGDATDEAGRVADAREFFQYLKKEYLEGRPNSTPKTRHYYVSEDDHYAVLWIKPSFDSENLKLSETLISGVEDKAREVLGADTPFQVWGRSYNHVHDTRQIQKDIAKTSWIGFGIIFLVLIGGLGGVRAALLTIVCVNLAMGWVLGFTGLFIGRVNIVTSFLLAILGGLGVEYGIHYIRRYYQERAAGLNKEQATEVSYFQMSRALLSAALTSGGAFLILSLSDFRGFSEMGIIAGFGILSIYCVYVLCFPLIAKFIRHESRQFKGASKILGFYPFTARWIWTLIPLAVLLTWGFQRAYFEYDFERMRQISKQTESTSKIVHDINNNRSTTPGALMVKDEAEARRLHTWIDEHLKDFNLHSVVSVASVLPDDMQERDQILEKYRRQIDKVSDETIRKKIDADPKQLREWLAAKPHSSQELPVQLRDAFGKSRSIVLTYTKDSLSQEAGLRNFDRFIKTAKQEFPSLKSGSDAGIFVEILDHINHDGKEVMILFLIGSFIVLFLDFRSWKEALNLEAQLVTGVLLLIALMGCFDVPFSILNIAMVPAVLAGGIDMGVHVRHRQLESGQSALRSARYVAKAVNLGALTSVIGFGSLFLAEAKILRGIAWISCLGQLSMYLVCMVAWPMAHGAFMRAKRQIVGGENPPPAKPHG